MATFLEIQNRVRTRIIDLPTAVLQEVPSLVNEAMRELQDDHDFKVMEFSLRDQATGIGSHTFTAVPSDFKKLRGRPYVMREDGTSWELKVPVDRPDALSRLDYLEEGPPQLLLDPASSSGVAGSRNFEIWPLPDGNSDYDDGEYRVSIPYWRYLPDLSSDGETNWFTNNAARYLVFKATAEGFFLDWDEDRGSVWEQKAALEKQRAIKVDKLQRLGAFETWVPYKGAHPRRVG